MPSSPRLSVRLVGLATAVLVVLAMLVVSTNGTASAATLKKRYVSVKISRTLVLGDQALAKGVVSTRKVGPQQFGHTEHPVKNGQVRIERREGSRWVKAATMWSRRDGTFSRHFPVHHYGPATYRARLLKTKKTKGAKSQPKTVVVQHPSALTLGVVGTPVTSEPVTFAGTVAPAGAHAQVEIISNYTQPNAPSSYVPVGPDGRFTFTQPFHESAVATYRVRVTDSAPPYYYDEATSSPVTVDTTSGNPVVY